MNRDKVILVDTQDNVLGEMDKLSAHQKGRLHRAFSIFIFNEDGEMLIHQRAKNKYHGANLWTNACCSHLQMNELLTESALERLDYEMGLQCPIRKVFSFIYHSKVENNLIEHELDYVFIGYTNQKPIPNKDEVADYKWMSIPALQSWINKQPEKFTTWFRIALPTVLNELEDVALVG